MTEPIYSPGLEHVVAGQTAISTITGGLHYRGYSIEDLATQATFEEVLHLVLHGELPTREELAALQVRLSEYSVVPPPIVELLRKMPPQTNLMDVMRTGASALAHWDPDAQDGSPAANLRKAERLAAGLPVILAARHRLAQGMEPVHADPKLPLAANLLWMLFRQPPDPEHARALDVSLILYAEHEYNASTFTARVVTSTLSDLHSAVTAAVGALKGPLHGGANERVLEVLEEVGSAERAEAWVREALAQKRRIMGFGHRVYKDGDPRATILREWCRKLADAAGKGEMEQIADTIEAVVRAEKKLPPNLDWPSARLYHYLQLPVALYTPLFVVARVVGWSAHVIEQLADNRLIRPRANYVGLPHRAWLPIDERGGAPAEM
jgi:citrate synthase